MTLLEGEVCPLGGIIQAAQDYKLFLRGEMSPREYYRRHPDEIPEAKASNILTDEDLKFEHPILQRYR